jgi:hypothetical protein
MRFFRTRSLFPFLASTARRIAAPAFVVLAILFTCCLPSCNPFAPAIDTAGGGGTTLIADQRTVDGVFQNLRYAYTFKDTTIYGALLSQDFIFSYRDYDKLRDVSWGRDDEMLTTSRLFDNAMSLSLIWNNILGYSGDSLHTVVTRSFNLAVTFNPSDVIRVDGRVSLELLRSAGDQRWMIVQWKDETDY